MCLPLPPPPQSSYQIDDINQALLGLLAPIFMPVTDSRGHVILEMLPDPYIKKAFGHLRRFAEFHMTEPNCATQAELEAAADNARDELLEYARLAEKVCDLSLLLCAVTKGVLSCVGLVCALSRGRVHS